MSAEDRLRQLLQDEAEDLIPAGDGLRRIEERLLARRSLRARLVPALAIGGVVLIAGGAAITVSLTDTGDLKQHRTPAHHDSVQPSPTTCAGGLCEEPGPSPAVTETAVTTSAGGTPLWPLTTDAQAADIMKSSDRTAWEFDAVQVTQHLMDDYLKLPGRARPRADHNEDVALVDVTAGGRTVSVVRLVRVGRAGGGPWSVVAATAEALAVTQPNPDDEVSTPIAVAGTAADPDTSVHLRLMTDRVLGEGYQAAGRDLPWTHSLAWSGTDWSVAALVANTFNGKGDLHAVTITAVRRSGASTPGLAPPGTTFLAVDSNHHVVTVDALTGRQLRQLSYPPAGATDSSPDRGGEDGVVWVRTEGDHCTSSIIRVGLVHGPAGVTVDAKPIARSLPALSDGGRSLAWVEQACGGGPSTVVVRGPDAKFSTTATTDARVDDLDVRDDGTAVLAAGGRLLLLRPGANSVSEGHVLPVPPGCTGQAPAWDGPLAVAFAQCGNGWQIVRYAANGTISSAQPLGSASASIVHASVADHHVLVVLADHRIARVDGSQLADVPHGSRWSQPTW